MPTIERNFNGTVYRVTVKEEERRMRMVEGEEESTLQEPRVTEVPQEETGLGGASSGLEESTVKVISLEVKVGQERGVLLQRWQQEGGEVNKVWIFKWQWHAKDATTTKTKNKQKHNSKVRYTKEGQGGVAAAEVKAFISICIFNVNTIPIITILNTLSISQV